MNKILLSIFLCFFFFGCSNSKTGKQMDSSMNTDEVFDNCTNSEFYKCIKSYIKEFSGRFIPDKFYYSICFFKKDSMDYFTIWSLDLPPNDYMDSLLYNFQYFKVDTFDIVLVNYKNNNELGLYQYCINQFEDIKKIPRTISHIAYDGSLYPRTYIYLLNQEKEYQIERSDKVFVEFLKDYPIDYFTEKEF